MKCKAVKDTAVVKDTLDIKDKVTHTKHQAKPHKVNITSYCTLVDSSQDQEIKGIYNNNGFGNRTMFENHFNRTMFENQNQTLYQHEFNKKCNNPKMIDMDHVALILPQPSMTLKASLKQYKTRQMSRS